MRAVRCDVCGAKAMIAAAQCPKCSHGFQHRDGFGELLPLAYCSGCESYYPESMGSCRWCGTKPERAPNTPLIWRAVGAVAFVGIVATAWILRDAAAKRETAAPAKTVASSTPAPKVAETPSATPTVVPQANPLPAPAQPAPVAAPTVDSAALKAAIDSAVRVATAAAPPAVTRAPATAAPSRQPARWVTSTSRRWVVIRTAASKESRIVASIGPNSRVQLGESRGTWRRIRAQGLAGWVEATDSFGPR